MRTWWDNEDILQRFREWLAQTDQDILALPERQQAAPAWDSDPETSDRPEWLDESNWADHSNDTPPDVNDNDPADQPAPELPSVGLTELLEAFTALRHETKLQTKAGRGLEDAVQASLQGLDRAIRHFETLQAREGDAADRVAKPFAEALANLDEALTRGAEAISSSQLQAARAVSQHLQDTLDDRFRRLSSWRQWWARSWHGQVREICQEEVATSMNAALHRVMEGYQLIHARLRRVMQEQGVSRISCVGQVVDPAKMTVVELVDDPHAEPEVVLEEVRPGYIYRGHVLRFAEVRAARKDVDSVVRG